MEGDFKQGVRAACKLKIDRPGLESTFPYHLSETISPARHH